jgi:glutamate racemase
LVGQIESGDLDSAETIQILRHAIEPMLRQGVDTIVLGCTHYPFVIPIIQNLVGLNVRVIDPAPAIARQTARLVEKYSALSNFRQSTENKTTNVNYFTTGDTGKFGKMIAKLLGEEASVKPLCWEKLTITSCLNQQKNLPDSRLANHPSP